LSSSLKSLSDNELNTNIPNAKAMRFGIVVSEWNHEITLALKDGAYNTLIKHGAEPDNILISFVPGSYELTLGAQLQLETQDVDAVICLGCVIQGETRHFDFICDAVAHGITNLNIKYLKPVIFGVLTPNNQQQAIDRAGGKHGNKGDEAAATAIKMLALKQKLK
jgi:6,7-dimethyl-8-ribityllumazine synthase